MIKKNDVIICWHRMAWNTMNSKWEAINGEQIITETKGYIKVIYPHIFQQRQWNEHKSICITLILHSHIFSLEMLYHFYWICLIYGAKGAVDVAIVDCNKGVPDGGGMIHQRPTVHPQFRARIDIPACIAIFDIKGNPEYENSISATIQSHSNP